MDPKVLLIIILLPSYIVAMVAVGIVFYKKYLKKQNDTKDVE